MLPPLLAYLAWIPVSLIFFRRYPIRVAILLNFIGGWAVLPAARYVPSADFYPYWILGNSLPAQYFLTKATVTGFTGLLWVLAFDRQIFRSFRLTFWDLPMCMWCIVPFLSAIANPELFGEGMASEVYQLLAWGVPYVLGRLYFSDTRSIRLAAKAFVIAGLLYVPFAWWKSGRVHNFTRTSMAISPINGYEHTVILDIVRSACSKTAPSSAYGWRRQP